MTLTITISERLFSNFLVRAHCHGATLSTPTLGGTLVCHLAQELALQIQTSCKGENLCVLNKKEYVIGVCIRALLCFKSTHIDCILSIFEIFEIFDLLIDLLLHINPHI